MGSDEFLCQFLVIDLDWEPVASVVIPDDLVHIANGSDQVVTFLPAEWELLLLGSLSPVVPTLRVLPRTLEPVLVSRDLEELCQLNQSGLQIADQVLVQNHVDLGEPGPHENVPLKELQLAL